MAVISSSRAIASAVIVTALILMIDGKHTEYYIGEQGQSCQEACGKRGLVCSTKIETRGSADIFKKFGIHCITDHCNWWAHDQPCYVSDSRDGNTGRCLGYCNTPSTVSCSARYWSVQRLCRCLKKPVYLMGNQGEDCTAACSRHGLRCSTDYTTLYGSVSKFYDLEVSCTPDYTFWWAHDQPCYVSGKTDINYGKCLGFLNIPSTVRCDGKFSSVQRLCHCV